MKRRQCLAILAGGALALDRARPVSAQAPVRVLLVLLGGGPHDIETNPRHLERALGAVGGVELTKWAPPAGQPGNPAHLARLADLKPGDFDVVVFYTVGQSLDFLQELRLRSFVERGGGIVALHGASASFTRSDTWFRLIGCRFAGHAPGTYRLPIAITDPEHPITKGVADFAIVDEEYTHRFADGINRHVVASFAQRPPNTSERNGNNDAVWATTLGRGRVVYNALGHGAEAWSNPSWLKLTVQSIFWAAGRPREVTLPGG